MLFAARCPDCPLFGHVVVHICLWRVYGMNTFYGCLFTACGKNTAATDFCRPDKHGSGPGQQPGRFVVFLLIPQNLYKHGHLLVHGHQRLASAPLSGHALPSNVTADTSHLAVTLTPSRTTFRCSNSNHRCPMSVDVSELSVSLTSPR
ncbi:unnamed protein product [Soboliphyme baturini]|uniref:Secreted protein n=1 Tax=Soboliphyme baturini TaxID=241478 RepID=A0A183IJ17_9BILA|nr:unnamed protein product [Soboliphyme baturini]